MARTPGTSARTQRLIALAATTSLGVVTAMAIGRVFLGASSSYRLMLAAAISAGLACALERKNLLIATSVSAGALLVVLGILVFPSTTWHGLPTLETLRAIGEAARVVGQEARFQVAPSAPLPALMLAALTATWAAVFSSHALAFRAGSPLLALLPPIALVAFADTVLEEFVKPVYGVLFLSAAMLVVFADGLRRVQGWGPLWTGPGREARLSVSTGRSARGVAFATVALALIAPLLLPGFGSKAILDFSTHDSDRVHIDPLVSVANRLQRDQPVDIFTVETTGPSYYRYTVLPQFDGAGWFPAAGGQPQDLPPNPAAGENHLDLSILKTSEAPGVTQQFHYVTTLEQSEVPVGAPAAALDLGQPAAWDPESGTVTVGGSLDEGTDYTATALQIAPTPDELRAVAEPTPAQLPQYYQLPDGLDPKIQQLAENIVDSAQATSAFDKAMAIQAFLAHGAYKYDKTVPTRDDSTALLDFLTVHPRGMCQQFATAMAAMLRMVGVPTRVAVGFTQGRQASADDPNLWTISTDDAHAWPEVLFPGYGWLAFEPTPGKTNPVSTQYYNPVTSSGGCDKPGGCSGSKGGLGEGGLSGKAPDLTGKLAPEVNHVQAGRAGGNLPFAPTPAEPERRVSGRALLLPALGLGLLFLLLVPVVRGLRRRRRLHRAGREPRRLILATYDVFTERAAELGFARGPGETPEEFRIRVHGSGLLRDGDLDRLTSLAVGAAYAAPDPSAEEARAASRAAETTLRDLRKGTPWGQRVRGLYIRER